jgi:hypothetical protein
MMRRSSAAWRNQSVRHTRPRPGRYFPPSLKIPPSFSDNFSFVRWISRSIFFHYYWSIGGRLRSWAEGCGSGVWRRRYPHKAQKKKKNFGVLKDAGIDDLNERLRISRL